MARLRSPSYPNFSLKEAIVFARKIYLRDRRHPVSREVAAQHMGFSGLTGSSDRALSALLQFGLAERAEKGEMKISELATRVLHPVSPAERKDALREAAYNPELFKDLRTRYPGTPPSQSSLSSHLSRIGFAPIAIGPASRAFIDTCHFLQEEEAYVIGRESDEADVDSASVESAEDSVDTEAPDGKAQRFSFATSARKSAEGKLTLNQPNLNIRSGQVLIEALLDLDGLALLEEHIRALRTILQAFNRQIDPEPEA